MRTNTNFYKIRNKQNCLFFSQLNISHAGFIHCKWNKTGKTWNSIKDIQSILKSLKIYKLNDYYYFFDNCEIVEFETKEVNIINLERNEKN